MQIKFMVYIVCRVAAHLKRMKLKIRDFTFTVDRCAVCRLNDGIVKLVHVSRKLRN